MGQSRRNADQELMGLGYLPRRHTVEERKSSKKYPFAAMLVNDFFGISDAKGAASARSAAWHFARTHPGTVFAVRRGEGGWVCRRIA